MESGPRGNQFHSLYSLLYCGDPSQERCLRFVDGSVHLTMLLLGKN